MSYYAGLAPAGGLRFPDDVAVIPLEYLPQEGRSRTQELLWGNNQRLVRGWLPARTPTQFVTVRSRPTTRKLVVGESPDRPGALQVENQLGARIEHLLVRAEDGQYYWASDVERGATARTAAIDASKARERMRDSLNQRELMQPLRPDRRMEGSYGYNAYSRTYGAWYEEDIPPPSPRTSLLETALAQVQSARLDPGSYAAVVEESPEVVLGTDLAHEEASLHVIMGNW
jgi:hypothetical protein